VKRLITNFFILALILPVGFHTASAGPPKRELFINLKGSPFEIGVFWVGYNAGPRPQDAIATSVDVINVAGKVLQAHSIAFAFFDPFNENLTVRTGVSMEDVLAGGKKTSEWRFRFIGDVFTTTVIAFPYRARTDDGKVWAADINLVISEIKRLVGSGFDPKKLDEP
jgi:hypothetical protein